MSLLKKDKAIEVQRHIKQEGDQKIKRKEKKLERLSDEKHIKQKDSLAIPQVQTKIFNIEPLKYFDVTLDVSKSDQLPLKIPQLNLAKFTLNKITNLDTAIQIKRETDKKLLIPQLRLETFKPISKYSNFDTEFEITVEQRSIKIPQLLLTRFKPIQPYERFLIDKPVQIQQPKLYPRVTSEEKIKEIVESITESPSELNIHEFLSSDVSTENLRSTTELEDTESKEYELGEFELFDLIFHRESGTLDFDEPLVICLEEPENDSYIGTVRTLCRIIYRERVGGNPKDRLIIETLNEFKEELRWIEAESRILSIKLSEKDWSKLTHEDWTRLWSRIKQFYVPGFRVIIFNRWLDYIGEHSINIVKLRPKDLPQEIRKEIVELFWGVSVSEDEISKPFDLLFEITRKKKERLLKRLESLEGGIYWDATDEDENESKEHRLLKAFIVRLIVKELRKRGLKLNTPTEIEEYIKTEYWVSDNTRADVYVDGKVFEIETLFAEDRGGKTIRDKLRKTFKKYENTNIKEINIILDNPTFIRHIGTILSLLRNYKDWMKMKQKNVKFYTINIEDERLIPLEEIINKLKDINKKIKNIKSS